MKKIILGLFLVVSGSVHAQTLNASIEKEYSNYSALMKAKDFDKALDYMHPAFFETYPKDQVKMGLDQIFNSTEMEFDLSIPVVSDFAEMKEIEGSYYVKFKSFQVTKMKFNMFNNLPADQKTATIKMMSDNMKTQFGEENFSYDDKTEFFTVKQTSSILAITKDKKDWKFADLTNKDQRAILEKFIPKQFFDN